MKQILALVGVVAVLVSGSAHEAANAAPQPSPKEVIDAFNQMAFFDNKPVEAVEKYFAPDVIEHDPLLPSGRAGIVEYLRKRWSASAPLKDKIYHVIAEDDLVAVHHHVFKGADDPGVAYVDIFRVHGGKVVEHWDVGQPVPTASANHNGVF
jgi:predicted SnoaL-like aldol condensation-catalyzing enzyme